eukprot:TRINITY_DN1778_c0_g3_i5.p1 TRINITY_DN1778_c0_g3~~TRINITY_DN1778_c0_g3_i5.p1  ORF type:complete len:181 (-),score=12.96 TRINITY_DN1778_c0_g3_i5:586-1071(-)
MAIVDMLSTPKSVSEIFKRTRKCRFFGMGTCTRGSTCDFAHTTEELRPRFNLSHTKMCPTLLKSGACTVDGCTYAHCHEDRRRKPKGRRQRTIEESTGESSLVRTSLCSLLFADASSEPSVDKCMLEGQLDVAKLEGQLCASGEIFGRGGVGRSHVGWCLS